MGSEGLALLFNFVHSAGERLGLAKLLADPRNQHMFRLDLK
jgi:hypothetical protein